MVRLTIALAALAMLATILPAHATHCQTTCTTIGNQQYCHTNCF